MTHPQHKVWELLRKHFPDDKADFIVSIVAPYLATEQASAPVTIRDYAGLAYTRD